MRNGMKKDAPAPATVQGGAGGAPSNAGSDPRRLAVPAMPDEPPTTPAVPAAKPKLYRVMNGGTIVWNSCRTALRAGKEVSDKDYDVRMLRRQGIRLEPIDPADYEDAPATNPVAEARQEMAPVLVPGTPGARAAAEQIKKMVDAEGKPLPVPSPQFPA